MTLTSVLSDDRANVTNLLIDAEWAARGSVQVTMDGVCPVITVVDRDGKEHTIPLLKQQSKHDGLEGDEQYYVKFTTSQIEEINIQGVKKGTVAIDYKKVNRETVPRLIVLGEDRETRYAVELLQDNEQPGVESRYS